MNIKLNRIVDCLVENTSKNGGPQYVRSQYDKLIAERDTSDVWRQFAIWFLVDPDHGVIRFTKHDSREYRVIKHVARLYDENCKDRNAWRKAAWDADKAADAADTAADDDDDDFYVVWADTADTGSSIITWSAYAHAAALAAKAAYVAAHAADAAYYASCAVFYAAAACFRAADAAADAAVDAAYAAVDAVKAAAYAVAAHAARLSFYKHMAEKLLELLQLAPPKENV